MKMKKKSLLTVIIALSMGSICQAQTQVSFGIRAGASLSGVTMKQEGDKLQSKALVGGLAGLYANLPLASSFYLQPSLQYEMKGGKFKATDMKTKLGYLTLPVDFLYHPGTENTGWFVGAGPYAGYGLSGKTTGGTEAKTNLFTGDDGLKRFDAGAHLQVGYAFDGGLNIALQTEYGLLNLQKKGNKDNTFHNRSYGITLGYTFGQ